MTCDEARAAISAAADGDDVAVAVVAAHLVTCAECARFEAGVRDLRAALRFEVVRPGPDVTDAVLARVAPPATRRRWLPVAAALLVGAVVGTTFTWGSDGGDVAVAGLPARVVAAQADVRSLRAELTVVEHHPDAVRRGTIAYRSPDRIELRLGAASLHLVGGSLRVSGPGGSEARTNLEPFPDDVLAPLEVVLPADGFTRAATPRALGTDTMGGRAAVGVEVPVAQVATLLAGLRPAGEGREVHPTDPVALWLDRAHSVPLRVTVRAGAGPDRARWAAARGYGEEAGEVVVDVRFHDVEVNGPVEVAEPEAGGADDEGFVPGPLAFLPAPEWLPPGMRRHRSGTVGGVEVATWTDGRAWLKIRAVRDWLGGRLFGDVGFVVRRVRVGDGVAYASEGGERVGVHAAGIDVVVAGSIEPADLLRVTGSLGLAGRPVPAAWAEASTVTLATVRRQVPGLLQLPDRAGFGPPAIRSDGRTVVLVYAGPGERAVALATREGSVLAPPFDPDAVGVVLRERTGRWSPVRGELEWVEGQRVWSLRSTSVGLAELVRLADRLRAGR